MSATLPMPLPSTALEIPTMRISLLALSLLAVAATGQQPQANPPQKAYLFFTIRTQLQRQYFFNTDEQYYLLIHGDSLVDGQGKIDPSRLDFEMLSREVARPDRNWTGDILRVDLVFAKKPSEAAVRWIKVALDAWAKADGFEATNFTTITGDIDWERAVRLTDNQRGFYTEMENEDAVGDESIRVFPIRTILSRQMSGDVDCVVLFPRPFGKDADGTLNADSKARVKELVEKLQLKERKRIQFGIWLNDASNLKAVNHFTEKTGPALAKELGFEYYSIAHRHTK